MIISIKFKKSRKNKSIILIVEDEAVNYLFLETLLNEEFELNCSFLHANNGNEAIKIISEFRN